MRATIGWVASAVAVALLSASPAVAAGDGKYVGASRCKTCHKKQLIGDQYAAWQKAPHAKALETLEGDEAAEIARKQGIAGPAHEADECLECHATAHGLTKAEVDKKPLKVSDGVQCESCHGPGSGYRKKKIMSDRDKAVARGLWSPGDDQKICTACHNDRSPTWDAVGGFDYEAAKEEIAHPIPEDVKGRYLEIVAERGGSDGDDGE